MCNNQVLFCNDKNRCYECKKIEMSFKSFHDKDGVFSCYDIDNEPFILKYNIEGIKGNKKILNRKEIFELCCSFLGKKGEFTIDGIIVFKTESLPEKVIIEIPGPPIET